MRTLTLILLSLLVIAGGCTDTTGPQDPTVTGAWSGTMVAPENPVTFWITVLEEGGQFTGQGALRIQGPPAQFFSFTVTGTHVHPNVSFTGELSGFDNFNFTGAFEGPDALRGRVRGSGLAGHELLLRREE